MFFAHLQRRTLRCFIGKFLPPSEWFGFNGLFSTFSDHLLARRLPSCRKAGTGSDHLLARRLPSMNRTAWDPFSGWFINCLLSTSHLEKQSKTKGCEWTYRTIMFQLLQWAIYTSTVRLAAWFFFFDEKQSALLSFDSKKKRGGTKSEMQQPQQDILHLKQTVV
jgi:hypothetical protein